MAIIYIQVVDEKKYGTLRGILGSQIPDTFDQWNEFLNNKGAQAQSGVDSVKNVSVDPDEFARYLSATNANHDLDALDNFTIEKASGKNY